MRRRLLEVCVDSLAGARVAQSAGADRIELCAALELDGLSPGADLLRAVVAEVDLPVMVMVRPRPGGFCYTADELALMEREIRALRDSGIQGVVAGTLREDGRIDEPSLRRLRDAAGSLDFTFHRAFDVSLAACVASRADATRPLRDAFGALLDGLVAAGVGRVLTSGGAPSVAAGLGVLRELLAMRAEAITVMPGGGVDERSLPELLALGAREVHASASVAVAGKRVTSADRVAAFVRILNGSS
ncbi:MAG: copper homeostasis protein CutC [Planctomycetota bacterium]